MSPKRIETLFAFVVIDPDGDEAVPTFRVGATLLPLTGADPARVAQLLPIAEELAARSGKRIELVQFEARVHHRWVEPAAERPPEARQKPEDGPEGLRVPYTNFDAPEASPVVGADGVLVHAAVTAEGPAVAVSYLVDGNFLPPIAVRGQVADDLHSLIGDALAAIQRTEN
jgi:hypothetical protein